MTPVYRILRRPYASKPLDGEGSYRFGGRWSSTGTRVAYTAEHFSLAMLEYFVHLDSGDLPNDLVSVQAGVPDSLSRIAVNEKELPHNWRDSPAPPELAEIGDDFVRDGRATILIVPSVIVPGESNWLINPAHSGFAKIKVHPVERFEYDPRFFKSAG